MSSSPALPTSKLPLSVFFLIQINRKKNNNSTTKTLIRHERAPGASKIFLLTFAVPDVVMSFFLEVVVRFVALAVVVVGVVCVVVVPQSKSSFLSIFNI